MANINVKFNNKDYLLSCDDGQEDNLKELASHLDKKYNDLKKNLGNIGENKLLLISGIKIIDEYFDLLKKVKKTKLEFEKLSIKFKELRTLAIDYKAEKELEIENLKKELDEFKIMIDKNKTSYEEVLDKTTKSIEDFIKSAENNQKTRPWDHVHVKERQD